MKKVKIQELLKSEGRITENIKKRKQHAAKGSSALIGRLKDMQNKITERKAREQIKSKDARVSKLTGSWNSHYSLGKLRKTLVEKWPN